MASFLKSVIILVYKAQYINWDSNLLLPVICSAQPGFLPRLEESFYNVTNGSSIIKLESLAKNFSKENKHILCSRELAF